MKDYIHLYEHPTTLEYNDDFLKSKNDYTLEELTVLCMKEYEAIENITLDYYEHITDMDEINMNEHRININFKKKVPANVGEYSTNIDEEIPNYKYIYEDACTEMRFYFTIKTNLNERKICKKILLPKPMDGFFIINGKHAKAIWQLVEASVYTQRGRITLKSRMPLIIYKQPNRPMTDIDGHQYLFKQFSCAMDTSSKKGRGPKAKKQKNKFLNPMLILTAKMGIFDAINFFGMRDAITITQRVSEKKRSKYYYFPLDTLYIKVSRKLFDENEMVQSVAGMLYYLSNTDNPVTWENIFDKEYWTCRVGIIGSAAAKERNLKAFHEKGKTTMLMFERHLKEITIMNLRLPEGYKENIYCVLRWMIMDYDELKAKDNIDVNNKRIRKNEYIIDATLGRKISEMINSLISKLSDSRQNDIDALLELFNYSSCIILNGMRNINDLIKSDDIVNDCNILYDLAYSTKGPEALGEKSTRNVVLKMRDIHPSFIGVIDPNCTSNSDIGMSGSFVPFVKIYDRFYFSPEHEPSHVMYDTYKDIETWADLEKENVNTDEVIEPIDINTGEVIDVNTDPRWNTTMPYDTQEHFDDALKEYNHLFNMHHETIEIVERAPEEKPARAGRISYK